MEKDTKYRKYLEGLKKATKKESFLERRMKLGGKDALSYAAKAAKASKYGKIAGAVAAAGIAGSAFLRSKMKDIKEKQQAEGKMGGGMMKKYQSGGLSPKASNDAFLKKRMGLEGVKSFLKIPKIGKIMGAAAAITAAGNYVGKKAYDKLKDKDKKMGGGMMYKYKSGGLSPKQKKIARMAPPPDKITGDDFKAMKTMKAKSGAMVYVKTKIGKNKPTKIC